MANNKDLIILTNFHQANSLKKEEILKNLGDKLAITYLGLLKNPQFDSREVSNNLNINK